MFGNFFSGKDRDTYNGVLQQYFAKLRLFFLNCKHALKKQLRAIVIIGGVLALVIFLLIQSVIFIYESTSSMRIELVVYESRGIITREQIVQLLDIKQGTKLTNLDNEALRKRLENEPAIAHAIVQTEWPDTLHIEVEEHVPTLRVELQDAALTGKRKQFFMDQHGHIFPIDKRFHGPYMYGTLWYLTNDDVTELGDGAQIAPERYEPILKLVLAYRRAASQTSDTLQLPEIKEIFRPKAWKIQLSLDNGTEVIMSNYEPEAQVMRLQMALEHARATKRHIRSANVIPKLNPTVIYAEQ